MRVNVKSTTQRIEVDMATKTVSVINAGPIGPPGIDYGLPVVTSLTIDDIVEITQAEYDALGAGRPASRLYLITS